MIVLNVKNLCKEEFMHENVLMYPTSNLDYALQVRSFAFKPKTQSLVYLVWVGLDEAVLEDNTVIMPWLIIVFVLF